MLKPDEILVFILAAGRGTRLGSLTADRPKALVEVNGIPLLQRVIKKIQQEGFTNCIINVHHFSAQIIDFLKQHRNFDLNIIISDETDQLMDTGGALLKALPLMQSFEHILIHNVDILSDSPLLDFCQHAATQELDASLMVQQRESSRKLLFDASMNLCGWHHLEKNERKLSSIHCKPEIELAFNGIHYLRKRLLLDFPVQKTAMIDLYLQAAETYMIKGNLQQGRYWFDLGKEAEIDYIELELRTLGID